MTRSWGAAVGDSDPLDAGDAPDADVPKPDSESVPADVAAAIEDAKDLGVAIPTDGELVEVVGAGLRLRGVMRTGAHGRFSDHVNLSLSALHLYEAALVDRSGHTHAILSEDLLVTKRTIVVLAELQGGHPAGQGLRIPKTAHEVVAIAPGFVVTGRVHLVTDAAPEVFFESADPPFVPLTGVEVRSRLGDGLRVRYPFALLNREQVAAIGLRPMGTAGRRPGERWDARLEDPCR